MLLDDSLKLRWIVLCRLIRNQLHLFEPGLHKIQRF
jgi:hypothetical protein